MHGQQTLTILCVLLTACSNTPTYAPVREVYGTDPIPKTGLHRVTKGETLYAVAWRYGLDYRELVQHNQIKKPYSIQSGQVIYLRPGNSIKPVAIKTKAVLATPVREQYKSEKNLQWLKPARGRIISRFSTSSKGINITGHLGEPVYASADGKIVYCGHGLRGYGNLIIIKHNSLYFSAYAHNRTVFIKEGDLVKQGQKIAEMGNTGGHKVMLHFEIRRAGKPIDPLLLLNSKRHAQITLKGYNKSFC